MNYKFKLYKKNFGKSDEYLTSVIYNDVVKDVNVGNFRFDGNQLFHEIGIDRLIDCIIIMKDEHEEEGFFYLLNQCYKVELEKN